MYFVTSKRAGYALFCMTPSERIAIGLTDDQTRVHVLERAGDGWQVRRDWAVAERSHTDAMLKLDGVPEPASVDDFVRLATS